jgi:PAS domain S-box-containing protein
MRLKNSLAIPIIILLVAVACGTLYTGYYLTIHSLRAVLEARERDKADNAFFIIDSDIKKDVDDLARLTRIISRNQELSAALDFYHQSGRDSQPVEEVMNKLFPHLGVDIFLVTDVRGIVLYRANSPGERGDVHLVWGMDEALSGQEIVAAGRGPRGLAVRALAPIYAGGELRGVVTLGDRLGDKLAKKIAAATKTEISFGLGAKLFASSLPPEKRSLISVDNMEQSASEKTPFFQLDYQNNLSFMYIPLKVADETVCLVINADTTKVSQLLRQKQRQLYTSFLPIFLAVVVAGSGLTLYIIRPLKKLQELAVKEIKEYSGEDLSLQGRGNEIQTLAHALALLLSAIHQHIDRVQQAQDAVQKGESFLADILDSITDGLSVLDTDLNILRVNRATELWFAHVMPLAGKKCYTAYHGRERPCDPCPALRTLATGEATHQVFLNPNNALGAPVWVELYTFPMKDPTSGKITGVIEYFRDITARQKTEDALRQSEEQLRQAQKIEAVGRLAGGVAHDFNNMLTAIGGYCDLLITDLDADDSHRQDVVEIKKAADRATSLTRQLLAFSRKQIIQPKPLNLNEVISNLDKMLRRLLSEDIDLLTIPGADLGWVMADPGQIEQAIVNLALNSRDAMPRGGKLTIETLNVELDEVYAGRHLEVQPGPYVLLAVSDTGTGLDEKAKAHIFEPFFTTKELGKGTGLGLSMVYGIVKQSGGYIWVYSEPGQGATFKIYLPRISQAPEAASLPAIRIFPDRGAETILLAEDEKAVRQVTHKMLEIKGYKVLAAAGGPAALDISKEYNGPIHLLLTDVLMPGMSGRKLAESLIRQRPETKVLFMSGHTENAIVHHGVLQPGIAFIQKPFRLETLMHKVREVLDAVQDLPPGP